ncbi:MAG: glucose-6-phosphate isomerase [Synergistaceae bacterium]|jgi:glucose-6-phosphate isomerase|nr:glucose-6-phosphate isomerase [Synergistaceae bacterium]
MSELGISCSFGCAAGSGRGSSDFDASIDALAPSLAEAAGWIARGAASDEPGFGWYNLPEQDISPILDTAEWLASYDSIIHVGIGGSALGNLMLHQALLPMYFNEGAVGSRVPRFYLADNPDPDKASAIWERVEGSRAALIGVSKSGATAETMSQFLWFRSRMEGSSRGGVDGDILVITDPGGGVFRTYASKRGCRSLEIPPSVGGRFSVLSACGLVTAAALGADVKALLSGAALMKKTLESAADAGRNPALRMAAVQAIHQKAGRPMTVMMPYSSRMETFAEWFAQLWGESVGKDGLGTTPIRALGAVDQHSQVQLYTAGPDDKLYTIINVRRRAEEIELPEVSDESLASLSYLSRQKLGEMLSYEAASTAAALVKAGRPVVWMELDRLDEASLGGLIFLLEFVTAATGRLMGINPFDQPGVEQGKRYTYGLMGRDVYRGDADEANEFFGRVRSGTVRA